jgi:citronellol/citronellal dehydrogenase
MEGLDRSLAGKTLLITGASRGIGKAIALRAARDGANIVVIGKTSEPHPKLDGTVFTAADEITAAGGNALACVCDVRNEDEVIDVVKQTAETFGAIDIVVNNASAIFLSGTLNTPMKRFDLMYQVNVRATFLVSQACLPTLKKAANPHILNLAPPFEIHPTWFAPTLAYTMAKYGMSLCVAGMSREFARDGIAVNALWPKTGIATAAVQNMLGGEKAIASCRHPEIVADAAWSILTKDSSTVTGQFLIDEEVLKADGETDFEKYAVQPGTPLMPDFFLGEPDLKQFAQLLHG